jgi:hypothetical protein
MLVSDSQEGTIVGDGLARRLTGPLGASARTGGRIGKIEETAGPRIVAPAFSIRPRQNALGPFVYVRLHDLAREATPFGPFDSPVWPDVLCDTVVRFG